MPPIAFKDFFIATAGASASFIGLLFVAISFVLDDEQGSLIQRNTRRILAETSYAALINIFFVSLVALIPQTPISYVMVSMGLTGIGNSVHFLRLKDIIRRNRSAVFVSVILYLLEVGYGIYLFTKPDGYIVGKGIILTLFMFLFVAGLTRAWELTGIRQRDERH